ncbi:g10190 [Coccomyxa elongata]
MQRLQSKSAALGITCDSRLPARRLTPSRQVFRKSRSQRTQPTQALFGWGNKDEQEWKRQEKEEAYRAQQEVLKRRRQGSWQKDVNDRRALVRKYNTDPEYKKKVDEDKRARALAERPPDPIVNAFNIIIPLAPFGIPEYDLGERFDLKAKYCDNGWVDEDAEFGKQVQRFFGFGKKKKPEDEVEQGPQGKGRKQR